MKSSVFKILKNLIFIAIGTAIAGFAYNIFNAKLGIVLGGVSGLSLILQEGIERLLHIDINFIIILIVINVFLILWGYKSLGRKFALYTIFGFLSYSLFLQVGQVAQGLDIPTSDPLICAIFGGALVGLGCGIALKYGGNTGGSDIIACIINNKSSKISIGTINIIFNTCIVTVTIAMNGFSIGLYSLINIYLCGLVIDYVLHGARVVSSYYIISEKNNEIAQGIEEKLGKHTTQFLTADGKTVLCCVLHMLDTNTLKDIVYESDKGAFVFATTISEAMNKGFGKLDDGSTLLKKVANKTFKNKRNSKAKTTTLEKSESRVAQKDKVQKKKVNSEEFAKKD